jgi:hypothetical protein
LPVARGTFGAEHKPDLLDTTPFKRSFSARMDGRGYSVQ